uniref:START domain-containing protein n=1 Tax=Fibrocapsa japonica TaxID=94617 RepID=A0A7S2UW72_9STRA|mmetsp:Transcript_16508/g.24261  ORF Transcript_16508/g.24261 Transcript_16508/m.24261 type:complete len:225 (+) Transcript_16508:96-770(+)
MDIESSIDIAWVNYMIRLIDLEYKDTFGAWKPIENGSGNKLHWRAYEGTTNRLFRIEMNMKCTMDSLINLLHYHLLPRHKEWNDTFEGGEVITKFNSNHSVQYWSYSPGCPFGDRDFLVERLKVDKGHGAVMLIDRSLDHASQPVASCCVAGYVRCDLPINVRMLEPREDGTVQFTYMNLTRLRGTVPNWFANMMNPKVIAEEVKAIKEICEAECVASGEEKTT